jgi:dihydrofolate synthase/folylpolyglutamate synthase
VDPLAYLHSLEQFGIKFGLDNITTLVARLGHPEQTFDSVHVAGTNGKGSVTAMVDSALRAAGHRSARYSSPHLVELNERFVIAGRPVETAALVAAVADVRDVIEDLRREGHLDAQPTFFEVTTAVAFELFRRARVDIAVLEVGLGGRLDATNVVAPPDPVAPGPKRPGLQVTAITSIAFDHEKYLGTTLRDIAREKAGIIKPGVPVVIGSLPDEAFSAIEEIARARNAPIVAARPDLVNGRDVGLMGAHQRANAAVALTILETLNARGIRVPADAMAQGLAKPEWPGRLDLRRLPDGRELLLDAAHNPAGAAALASYLRDWCGADKPPLVFAAMRDKDIARMFDALLPTVSALIVTRASTSRAAPPDELAAAARRVAPALPIFVEPTPQNAVAAAWQRSNRIVVAGSIFLLGDVLKLVEAPW